MTRMPEFSWDRYFIGLAEYVSTASKDPSTQTGAVIVRPNRTIVSTGYNGFPRGCDDSPELYANRELKYARVVHAEVNAVLHAPEPVTGCTLYTWPPNYGPSCDRCTSVIIQAGIERVVHVKESGSDFNERWRESIDRGLTMYAEAGVEVLSL